MRITQLFNEFFESEKSAGMLLILVTAISLLMSNSMWGSDYIVFWKYSFLGMSLEHWINDGLMSIFFLLIGLELEREMYQGELSNLKEALLPIIGAIGGMVIPLFVYASINILNGDMRGVGVPMATDIAFALGVLSLLGRRVPVSLKVFLTALAVIDDLGAILVIAIFYTATIGWKYLLLTFILWLILFVFNRLKVHFFLPYLVGGIAMWYCMHRSGIHASISGVILAFVIPFGNGAKDSLSYRLQHHLHKPVAYLILPVFALCNTAFILDLKAMNQLKELPYIGIFLALLLGKPLGIYAAVKAYCSLLKRRLPADLKDTHILGAGILGGIGFTMSIFIAILAFDEEKVKAAKIAILLASLFAGAIGYLYASFRWTATDKS